MNLSVWKRRKKPNWGGGRYQCSHGYGPAARHPSLMVGEGRPIELGAVCMCPVAKTPSSPPRGEPVSRPTSSEGRAGCGGWLAFQLRRCSSSEVPIADPHTRCLRTEADSCPVLYPEISAPGPSGPSQQRRKIPGGGGGSCIPQVPAPRATPTCVAEGGGPSLVPRGKHVLLKVELCGRLS